MTVLNVIGFFSRCLVRIVPWLWFSLFVAVSVVPASTNSTLQYSSSASQTDAGLPQNTVKALAQAALGAQLGSAHFWQSRSFTEIASLATACMLAFFVRHATRRKLQRQMVGLEQLNAIEKERTRIAQDMHDDLGARLTEILLLNELARSHKQDAEHLDNYLSKQSHAVRDVAESLDTIVWAVNPVHDSLDRLANYLCEQVERSLSMSSIRCRFDVPDELPRYFISSEMRHNVFLTVRECLNNVIKHSGATEVWFRLRHTSTALSLVIEDNGKGISPADRSASGNGLLNMEKRMKNLGGSFRLASQPGNGAKIHLEVPLRPVADERKRTLEKLTGRRF